MKTGPPGSTINWSHAEQPASPSHVSTLLASNVHAVTTAEPTVTTGRPCGLTVMDSSEPAAAGAPGSRGSTCVA